MKNQKKEIPEAWDLFNFTVGLYFRDEDSGKTVFLQEAECDGEIRFHLKLQHLYHGQFLGQLLEQVPINPPPIFVDKDMKHDPPVYLVMFDEYLLQVKAKTWKKFYGKITPAQKQEGRRLMRQAKIDFKNEKLEG